MKDLAQRLTSFLENVGAQARALPEFSRGLANGYPSADLSSPRYEMSKNPFSGHLDAKVSYPTKNQFMGHIIRTPLWDTQGKGGLEGALNGIGSLPTNLANRAGIQMEALDTGGSFDGIGDFFSQVKNTARDFGDFVGGQSTTPFGEAMNFPLGGGEGLTEKPYSALKTQSAKFNYLKKHPEFTPPEWVKEDEELKKNITDEQWPIFQMFRSPRSPRIRKKTDKVLGAETSDGRLNEIVQEFSRRAPSLVEGANNVLDLFTRKKGALGPLDTGSLYGKMAEASGGATNLVDYNKNTMKYYTENPTESPAFGFIGDIQPISAAAHAANASKMIGSQNYGKLIRSNGGVMTADEVQAMKDIQRMGITDPTMVDSKTLDELISRSNMDAVSKAFRRLRGEGVIPDFENASNYFAATKDAGPYQEVLLKGKKLLETLPEDSILRSQVLEFVKGAEKTLVASGTKLNLSSALSGETPIVQMYANQVRNGVKTITDLMKDGVDMATVQRVASALQKVAPFVRQ